jgi:hypothetical protein
MKLKPRNLIFGMEPYLNIIRCKLKVTQLEEISRTNKMKSSSTQTKPS